MKNDFLKAARDYLKATTVADLETLGFKRCEPPDDYDDSLGGIYYFMESPDKEVFIVSQGAAQNLRTDDMIDPKTGQPLGEKGPPYSKGFNSLIPR